MPQGRTNCRIVTQPFADQVDAPTKDHTADGQAGEPRVNIASAVDYKDGNLVIKVSRAFFHYLRNRCL